MSDDIAIMRRCRCCLRWRSIDRFADLGRVCRDCMNTNVKVPTSTIARARGIAITAQGRAALRTIEAA